MKTNLLSIVLLLFATGAFAQHVDLLDTLNGDFELEDSLWRFIEIDNGAVVTDLSTLEFVEEDNGNHYAKWSQMYSPNHNEMVFDKWAPLAPVCKPDTDYTIKFDAYMESGYGTLVVCTGFFDENGGFLQDVKYYDLKNPGDKEAFPPEWAHYAQVVHSPANAATIYVGFRIYNQAVTDTAEVGGNVGDPSLRWPLESESPAVVDIDHVQIIEGVDTSTTGINDYVVSSIKVYPNPVYNSLTVESGSIIYSIEVCDITGKVVKTMNKISRKYTTLNMEGLTKGLYFVKVRSKNGTSLTKVIHY